MNRDPSPRAGTASEVLGDMDSVGPLVHAPGKPKKIVPVTAGDIRMLGVCIRQRLSELKDVIDALDALVTWADERAESLQWRDISTAPPELNVEMLCAWVYPATDKLAWSVVRRVAWRGPNNTWWTANGQADEPTLWMPIIQPVPIPNGAANAT